MGITALGHRKTILKGAEDLRVHRRVVNPPQPPPGAELQESPNRQKYSSMENSAKEEAESSMGAHGSPVCRLYLILHYSCVPINVCVYYLYLVLLLLLLLLLLLPLLLLLSSTTTTTTTTTSSYYSFYSSQILFLVTQKLYYK